MPRPRPTIRHYPKNPPKPPVETDLKTLGDAANEAAKRESAQWFYFLTIMITLAALVGSTTHRVLFLEDPVRVPILGVELPLLGFYVAAPAIFVVLHLYLLAQLQVMADKVHAFLDAVANETPEGSEHRARALRRLDSFSVAQLMAADRFGGRSLALRLMVSVTLVLAPLALLLFFQLRFLPHHTFGITLWHQFLVTADVVLLWWLWPFAADARRNAWRRMAAAVVSSFGVIGFSWLLAVIPGDDPDGRPLIVGGRLFDRQIDETTNQPIGLINIVGARLFGDRRDADIQASGRPPNIPPNLLRAWLFDGRTDDVTQRPTSPFARRLVLLDQVFLTEAERKTWAETPEADRHQIGRTRVLRGRDLRFAELNRADLRRADLTGAFLQGAVLARAQMQGAELGSAQLHRANLDRAQMQGAVLRGAQMQGADLSGAQMQGAVLRGAQMQGADLRRAQMQGANLASAQIQGAILWAAQMQGAVLSGAQMQGADLSGAQMQGAGLGRAQMQGVVLWGAQMQGAVPSEAQMQGADLRRAQMQGADLSGAQAWRLRARDAVTSEAVLNGVDFGAEPPCEEPPRPDGSCRRAGSWRQAVEAWLAQIPSGARRDAAQRRLAVLLEPEDPPEADRTKASWQQAMPPDPGRVADLLVGLACGAEHAPHLARRVLWQIWWPQTGGTNFGPHRAALAARMLGDDCPGAQGLRTDERAQLARIASGQN